MACERSTQQRLGGQTSLPCGDRHGARWSQPTKRGSRLAERRLHGSLIAEEATSARNATTAAALVHRRRTTAPRVIHMEPLPPPPRPTVVAKGVVGTRQRTQEVRAEHRRGKNNIPNRNIIFPHTIINTIFGDAFLSANNNN